MCKLAVTRKQLTEHQMLQHRSEHLSAGHIISESEYHPQEIPSFIVQGMYTLYLTMLEYSPNLKPAVHVISPMPKRGHGPIRCTLRSVTPREIRAGEMPTP